MTSTEVDRSLNLAVAYATDHVPLAASADTVAGVLAAMRGKRFDVASVVVVCDDHRVVGTMTVERLFSAPGDATIAEHMDTEPPIVAGNTDVEQAAWRAVHRSEPALVVVDADRRLLGVVPPHRLMAVLLAAHDQDLARLSGFLGTASTARKAAAEPVRRRLWHRLPWLLLGLVGAMLSAQVVGAFDETLQERVLLAFFIPAVVYMADAVGTQTETLVVRGLSVGVPIGRVAMRELITGIEIGVLLGALAMLVTWMVWGDAAVAGAVGLAFFAACSVATLVAMALPWLIARLGADPAYGSGPVATVVQDLLSIAIYLVIATAIVL